MFKSSLWESRLNSSTEMSYFSSAFTIKSFSFSPTIYSEVFSGTLTVTLKILPMLVLILKLALSSQNWDNICTVRKGRRGSNDQKRQAGRTRGETRRVGDLGVLWLQIRDSNIKRAFQKTPFPTSTIIWRPGGQVEKIVLRLMCPVDGYLIEVQTTYFEIW